MFHSSRLTHSILFLFLLALFLIASPAFALYPEEADPDPDLTNPGTNPGDSKVLTLGDHAALDGLRLEPGRYLIRIVDGDGIVQAVYEIEVRG